MFPCLLDRAWDELEDYKVEMFDSMLAVQDKLVSELLATHTELDQDAFDAEENEETMITAVWWLNLLYLIEKTWMNYRVYL